MSCLAIKDFNIINGIINFSQPLLNCKNKVPSKYNCLSPAYTLPYPIIISAKTLHYPGVRHLKIADCRLNTPVFLVTKSFLKSAQPPLHITRFLHGFPRFRNK